MPTGLSDVTPIPEDMEAEAGSDLREATVVTVPLRLANTDRDAAVDLLVVAPNAGLDPSLAAKGISMADTATVVVGTSGMDATR